MARKNPRTRKNNSDLFQKKLEAYRYLIQELESPEGRRRYEEEQEWARSHGGLLKPSVDEMLAQYRKAEKRYAHLVGQGRKNPRRARKNSIVLKWKLNDGPWRTSRSWPQLSKSVRAVAPYVDNLDDYVVPGLRQDVRDEPDLGTYFADLYDKNAHWVGELRVAVEGRKSFAHKNSTGFVAAKIRAHTNAKKNAGRKGWNPRSGTAKISHGPTIQITVTPEGVYFQWKSYSVFTQGEDAQKMWYRAATSFAEIGDSRGIKHDFWGNWQQYWAANDVIDFVDTALSNDEHRAHTAKKNSAKVKNSAEGTLLSRLKRAKSLNPHAGLRDAYIEGSVVVVQGPSDLGGSFLGHDRNGALVYRIFDYAYGDLSPDSEYVDLPVWFIDPMGPVPSRAKKNSARQNGSWQPLETLWLADLDKYLSITENLDVRDVARRLYNKEQVVWTDVSTGTKYMLSPLHSSRAQLLEFYE